MTHSGDTLQSEAHRFAESLTFTTRGVLGDVPRFQAVNRGSRIWVAPLDDQQRVRPLPVSIDGEHVLDLEVVYYCCWDQSTRFLATDSSRIAVYYAQGSDPLLRYEYERGWTEIPGAHLHVHAHRDEMAYLIRLADRGRPRNGLRRRRLPRLSEMHFTVGGHRMRPALEDVLLLLKREFEIDTADNWRDVIQQGLRQWRNYQVRSAVRDAPHEAAEVLRELGYTVQPPPTVPAPRPSVPKLYQP